MTLRYAFTSASGFNRWIFKLLAGNHDDDAQKIPLDAFYDTGGLGTDLSHHSVLPSVAFAPSNARGQRLPALSDFEILQPPQITRKSITTTHCRNRSTEKLFTLKSKLVDSQAVSRWPEQLCLECMRDFTSTQVQTAFIPYLHAVFQEGEQIYLVLVCRLPWFSVYMLIRVAWKDPEPTLTLRGLVSRHDGFLAAEVVLFYASEIVSFTLPPCDS